MRIRSHLRYFKLGVGRRDLTIGLPRLDRKPLGELHVEKIRIGRQWAHVQNIGRIYAFRPLGSHRVVVHAFVARYDPRWSCPIWWCRSDGASRSRSALSIAL